MRRPSFFSFTKWHLSHRVDRSCSIYRDFIRAGGGLDGGIVHPDFNAFGSGVQEGMVASALGAYRNSTYGSDLFPLNELGWVDANLESLSSSKNFGFTSEVRAWFEYKGNKKLTFAGDDDVWVFINGRLAMDLGGIHGKTPRTIVLDKASGDAKCYTHEAATTP